MTSRMGALGALSAVALVGCAHNLYLTDEATGATAKTVIEATPGHPSGTLTAVVEGKTYTGRWVYVAGPGSFSLVSATAVGGRRALSGFGSAMAIPTDGNGLIVLTARDGSVIRCVFNYSRWSRSGAGTCRNKNGRVYDLEIS